MIPASRMTYLKKDGDLKISCPVMAKWFVKERLWNLMKDYVTVWWK